MHRVDPQMARVLVAKCHREFLSYLVQRKLSHQCRRDDIARPRHVVKESVYFPAVFLTAITGLAWDGCADSLDGLN